MTTALTFRLGNISSVTISSTDLEASLAFWQKLGYSETMRMEIPFPWIQISDGTMLVMLRKDPNRYIALTYFIVDIDEKIAALEKSGILFSVKPGTNDMVKRALIKSPDGINIGLVSYVPGFEQPGGQTLLTMPQEDFFNPEKYVNKKCGIFGEFAHPVKDLEASLEFWELLGFKAISKMTAPYPWAIISDGISIVGLHQTTNFTEPTITFFAADSKDKMSALENEGITSFIEKGNGNYTLTTPENQNINLFKLGM